VINEFPNFLRTESVPDGTTLPPAQKLVFHHIPKTAGSTLRGMLTELFSPSEICPAETVEELNALKDSELAGYRLFAGHFSYSAIKKYIKDGILITFLREPNERVISQYHNHVNSDRIPEHWKKRVSENPVWSAYLSSAQKLTLYEWVTSTNKHGHAIACNRQTQAFLPSHVRKGVADWSVHNPEFVSLAKKNLEENFAFIGIKEYFQLSLSLFSATFGLLANENADAFTTNFNPSKSFSSRYAIEPELYAIISQRNSMDWELYEFGVSLFLRRTEALIAALCQKDRSSRLERDLVSSMSHDNRAPVGKIKLPDLLGANGFHQLEKTRLGKAFKWSGASKKPILEFAYPMKKNSDYVLSLECLSVFDNRVLDDIILTLDNKQSETIEVKKNSIGGGLTLNFRFSCHQDSHYHRLQIQSPRFNEDKVCGEGRMLGLALHSLNVDKV